MIEITKYRIELVIESSTIYDITDDNISSPEKAYEIIKEKFKIASLTEEIFGILCCDIKNKVVGVFEVSHGDIAATIVHPREVFKRAILMNCHSIILFHNHPSGEVEPSKDDINITNRLKESGKIIGINVLDHIIVSYNSFLSFKEQGY